jgi:hypothetical protein
MDSKKSSLKKIPMIKNLVLIVLAFTVFHLTLFPQDGLSLILVKGEGSLATQTNSNPVALVKALKVSFPQKSVVSLSAGARALVFNTEKRMEIGGDKAVSLTTDAITMQLKNVKTSSATVKFFEFLNKMNTDKRTRDESAGSTGGAASRGVKEMEFTYSPDDSSVIISDTVRLSWSSDGYYRLIKNLLVINTSRGDTVFNVDPALSTIFLCNLKEGEYHWSTRIKTKDEGITLEMNNIFYVPSESERKGLKEDMKQFRKLISSFTVDTRTWLMDEYMKQNKLYYYNK